jgi:hypothetical protein
VRHTYQSFLGLPSFLKKNSHKIAFIGLQTELDSDFMHLRALLALDEDIHIPKDDTRAHRNPINSNKALSETALENLKKWYAIDYEIYDWCLEKRQSLLFKKECDPS